MSRIGSSDLDVYPLNLGGNTFGWTSDAAESFAVLDEFVSAGGNFIDTSDSYMASAPGNVGGESETILGEWFTKRGRRDDIVLATKVSRHPEFLGLAPDNIARAAEASLRRLKTDHIDLYYAHYDDPDVPLADTLGAFDALVKAGKVRHVGISNYSAVRIQEWIDVAEANRFAKPVALQPHYSGAPAFRGRTASTCREVRPRSIPVLGIGERVPHRQIPHRGRCRRCRTQQDRGTVFQSRRVGGGR